MKKPLQASEGPLSLMIEGEVPVLTESESEEEQDVQQPLAKKKRAAQSSTIQ